MEQRNKIPKIIHFCWLSGEEMPAKLKECIQTWKRIMPDYELRCWDMNSFDIHSVRFVEQACSMKKWALQQTIFGFMLFTRVEEYIWIRMF